MERQRRCLGCMREIDSEGCCPFCGYDAAQIEENPVFLHPGTVLNDRYMLGRVLGQGGFGITYIGYDEVLHTRIAVKEFFPAGLVQRNTQQMTIQPYSQSAQDFAHSREKFLEEARTLAKFSDEPGIVGIKDCFAANGTAYMVMQYLDGISLKQYLEEKGGVLPPDEAVRILTPVMDVLRQIHQQGIIHRDISPDNIMITVQGQVKLIDFGAARQLMGGERSLSVLLKPGYAPEEQYRTKGEQGPWTDVYGLCATLYRMVTGVVPPESLERLTEDRLVLPPSLPEAVKQALQSGLAVKAAQRVQTVDQLMDILRGEDMWQGDLTVAAGNTGIPPYMGRKPVAARERKHSKSGYSGWQAAVIGMSAAVLILAMILITVFTVRALRNDSQDSGNSTALSTEAPDTAVRSETANQSTGDSGQNTIEQGEMPSVVVPPTERPTAAPTEKPAHRYSVVTAHVTWEEANQAAQAAGGYLATISDQAEFEKIKSVLSGYSSLRNVWIGARLSGTFHSTAEIQAAWRSTGMRWITGEPFVFQSWRSGEPSGYDAKLDEYEFYLQLFCPKADGYTWSYNDSGNDLSQYRAGTLGYVIEYDS